jgi:hypothetical protein
LGRQAGCDDIEVVGIAVIAGAEAGEALDGEPVLAPEVGIADEIEATVIPRHLPESFRQIPLALDSVAEIPTHEAWVHPFLRVCISRSSNAETDWAHRVGV